MFEKDYIMRLINEIIRTLFILVFHKDTEQQELQEEEVKAEYGRLLKLLDEGNVNDAENQLLEGLDADNKEHFKMALLFYLYLNEKDNEFLEEHGYTREEIAEGIQSVSKIYGCEGLADVFMENEDSIEN